MSLNKGSRDYTTGGSPDIPKAVGDVYRAHDLLRDLEYLQERTGRLVQDILGVTENVLLSGGVVTQGTGDTLNITATVGYVKMQVQVPDSYASNPPTLKNEDTIRRVEFPEQTDMAIGSAVLDGGTTNYVKLRAAETDGSSRSRLKDSGSYVYEKVDSFEIVVDDSSPGTYDLLLATFTGSTGGTFTITQNEIAASTDRVVRRALGFDWEWTSPAQIGSGLAISDINYAKITALNGTDVALVAAFGINATLATYRFDGSTWSQIGSTLTITDGVNPFITALNGTDVAFIDVYNDDLRTYRFNGSIWSQVGSDLPIGTGGILTTLNGTDIALWYQRDLKVYRFDGSTWSQVGSTFTISGTYGSMNVSMTALNGTDIVYCNDFDDVLEVYRFDGSTWSQIGSTLSISVTSPSIAALNGTDVALIDGNNDQLRMYSFNGSTWERVVYGLPLPSAIPSITALNGTDIAYINHTTDNLQTYRFGFHLSGMKPHALSWV